MGAEPGNSTLVSGFLSKRSFFAFAATPTSMSATRSSACLGALSPSAPRLLDVAQGDAAVGAAALDVLDVDPGVLGLA